MTTWSEMGPDLRWETAKEKLEAAKERNANQILELRQWRDERSSMQRAQFGVCRHRKSTMPPKRGLEME